MTQNGKIRLCFRPLLCFITAMVQYEFVLKLKFKRYNIFRSRTTRFSMMTLASSQSVVKKTTTMTTTMTGTIRMILIGSLLDQFPSMSRCTFPERAPASLSPEFSPNKKLVPEAGLLDYDNLVCWLNCPNTSKRHYF